MLITNATIVTLDRSNRVIADGAVFVEDGLIREVGKTAALRKKHRREKKVEDARGMVLMPGLINAHMHLYSTLARGMALPGEPPVNFEQILQHLWWRLDRALRPDDLRVSALVPLIAGIRAGTTTLIDHHASPSAIDGSLDILADAVRDTGVRAALCYEVSDRDGPEIARRGISENIRFLTRAKGERSPMLRGHFGLHAQFTIEDATLRESCEAARDLGAGVHIHCAEGFADLANAMQRHGCSPVERLAQHGALGPDTILAHCVHINEDDRLLIRDSDTFVSHQPRSNMNNAVGAMDLEQMRLAEVPLALGTDGMSNNMWDEVRVCHLIHNHNTADPRIGMANAFEMLFLGNRALAERTFGVKMGQIARGSVADLILVDYHPPTPLTRDTVMGHVFFGLGDARVDSTMVDGRWLMRRGRLRLRGIDEAEIAAEAQARARRLWRRV
jgi:putative selenium metabolism protein SsnA